MSYVDKILERDRYNDRAKLMRDIVGADSVLEKSLFGAREVPTLFRAPYLHYESQLQKYIFSGMKVLEIGSGTGTHTGSLLSNGAIVTATDISEQSLEYLFRRYDHLANKLCLKVADMESLPFGDQTFDLVTSAGSLSYGENLKVLEEIHRVLTPGGYFICVDSFNHNPIYRLNRWIHYLSGRRTKSTLNRMPKIKTIKLYEKKFGTCEVWYFGAISWLTPLIVHLVGDSRAALFSDLIDKWVGCKRSAFKFVMVAQKKGGN